MQMGFVLKGYGFGYMSYKKSSSVVYPAKGGINETDRRLAIRSRNLNRQTISIKIILELSL
jgi:hypothetical protein